MPQVPEVLLLGPTKQFIDRAPGHFGIGTIGKEQPVIGTAHIGRDRVLLKHGLKQGGRRRCDSSRRGRRLNGTALFHEAEQVHPVVIVEEALDPQDLRRTIGKRCQAKLFLFTEYQHAPFAVVAMAIQITAEDLPVAASGEAFGGEIVEPGKGCVDRDITQFAVLHIRRQVKRGNLVAD